MNLAEMKEKIVKEVSLVDDEKILQRVLHVLNDKNINESKSIHALKYKDQLFNKHDGLLKRLS